VEEKTWSVGEESHNCLEFVKMVLTAEKYNSYRWKGIKVAVKQRVPPRGRGKVDKTSKKNSHRTRFSSGF